MSDKRSANENTAPVGAGNSHRVLAALSDAVREAVWQHKLAGNPVATWRDGRVHWLQPDEISLPGHGNGKRE